MSKEGRVVISFGMCATVVNLTVWKKQLNHDRVSEIESLPGKLFAPCHMNKMTMLVK